MVFDKSVHLQWTGTFAKWLFTTDRVSSERLGDFWLALQALRFSVSLKLVYRGVLSLEDRPRWWHVIPAEDPRPGPWHFLMSPVFQAQLSVFFPRQHSGYFRQRLNVSGEFSLC